MTGLDKIIKKIQDESDGKCKAIIEDAERKASELISVARSEANRISEKNILDAHKEAERITAVTKSSAETVSKKKYLEVKNAIINDIISASYEKILKLSDKEYFDTLFRLCVKYVETGECLLYLNSKDLHRLPDDFENRINSEVYERAAVQVSKTPADIENGFVLDYGNFSVDCTLRSVFDDSKDLLKDILNKELFGEEL